MHYNGEDTGYKDEHGLAIREFDRLSTNGEVFVVNSSDEGWIAYSTSSKMICYRLRDLANRASLVFGAL